MAPSRSIRHALEPSRTLKGPTDPRAGRLVHGYGPKIIVRPRDWPTVKHEPNLFAAPKVEQKEPDSEEQRIALSKRREEADAEDVFKATRDRRIVKVKFYYGGVNVRLPVFYDVSTVTTSASIRCDQELCDLAVSSMQWTPVTGHMHFEVDPDRFRPKDRYDEWFRDGTIGKLKEIVENRSVILRAVEPKVEDEGSRLQAPSAGEGPSSGQHRP